MTRKSPKADVRLSISQSFVAGGFAGVLARTATSPLDVAKILMQVGCPSSGIVPGSRPFGPGTGLLTAVHHIWKEEGWRRGFWKGNGVACLKLFPYNALQFVSYTRLKVELTDPHTGRFSAIQAMVAGSLAGIVATACTFPFDLAKTRLTIQYSDPARAKYRGIAHVFSTVVKEEGFMALYKGLWTSILGVIPFAGGTFMAYEFLDRAWGKPKDRMSAFEHFVNGCLAAAFAQTCSFPFDTVRKKLQATSFATDAAALPAEMRPDVAVERRHAMLDCFRQTVKHNGVLGLWRGNFANLLKICPYAGLMFVGFEGSKRGFLWSNGYTEAPWDDAPRPGVPQDLSPAAMRHWCKLHQPSPSAGSASSSSSSSAAATAASSKGK